MPPFWITRFPVAANNFNNDVPGNDENELLIINPLVSIPKPIAIVAGTIKLNPGLELCEYSYNKPPVPVFVIVNHEFTVVPLLYTKFTFPVPSPNLCTLVPDVVINSNLDVGVAVPIPNLLLVSSQNKLALSCCNTPDVPANKTEPAVADVMLPPIAIEPPPPLYCGMLSVAPTNVAAPEVPVVVRVNAACLLLNVVQSAELKAPLFVADAVGRLNVCVSPLDTIPKLVPLVPVAKY